MRKLLLVAAASAAIGGITTMAVQTQAQPAPPPGPPAQVAPPPPGSQGAGPQGMGPHGMGRSGHGHGSEWQRQHHGGGMRAFGLVFPQQDRQLAPADVQKIAEAFLLWHGNHTWKVTDVAPTANGPIGFSLTTPEGSVVAKFTMDPHTGKVARLG